MGGKEPRVCWALPCTGAGLSQNTGAPRGVAGFIVLSAPSMGDAVQMIPIWKEAKHIKTCHSSKAPGTDLAATAASPRGSYPPRSTLTLVLSLVCLLQPCTAAASCLPQGTGLLLPAAQPGRNPLPHPGQQRLCHCSRCASGAGQGRCSDQRCFHPGAAEQLMLRSSCSPGGAAPPGGELKNSSSLSCPAQPQGFPDRIAFCWTVWWGC